MSTPAGWYDDGSGRQRWWDGSQWTERYATEGADAVPVTAAGPGRTPMLGFVGLGLAVLGTILVCIPTVVTFWIGAVVLLAAFVVSLVAVFQKDTAKWPSIVGMVLSIVGGVVGVIVLVFTLLTAIADLPSPGLPGDLPASASSEPSDPPATGDSEGRPSPEAIAEGLVIGLKDEPGIDEFKTPEAAACIGQHMYDSDVSDALLRHVAAGEVITEEMAGDEAATFQSVLFDAGTECVYG